MTLKHCDVGYWQCTWRWGTGGVHGVRYWRHTWRLGTSDYTVVVHAPSSTVLLRTGDAHGGGVLAIT